MPQAAFAKVHARFVIRAGLCSRAKGKLGFEVGLAKNDELELLYLHLSSMRNFSEVKDRLMGTLASGAEPKAD